MSYNGYRAGEEIVGVNPKVNNLMEAYRAAKHDFIDSNVSVVPLPDILQLRIPNRPQVGLAHYVPYAVASERDSTIGTQLERCMPQHKPRKDVHSLKRTGHRILRNGQIKPLPTLRHRKDQYIRHSTSKTMAVSWRGP